MRTDSLGWMGRLGMTTLTENMRMVAFDLDDTLAPSKSRVDPEIANLLVELATRVHVCIISGGRFEQFESQVMTTVRAAQERARMPDSMSRFHLMPMCGTQYYKWAENGWSCIYSENLPRSHKEVVIAVVTAGARELGLWERTTWGPRFEDRGSQVTFSALGQNAPVPAKGAWDPDGAKKERLRAYAASRLPDLEVRSGGSTSIDVTRKGVDKAYGMRRLMDRLGMKPTEIVLVGDRLDLGGNDYPVKATGIPCRTVENWQETAVVIRALIHDFDTADGRPPSQRAPSQLS